MASREGHEEVALELRKLNPFLSAISVVLPREIFSLEIDTVAVQNHRPPDLRMTEG